MKITWRKSLVVFLLLLFFGGLVGWDAFRNHMIEVISKQQDIFPVTISTAKVTSETWHPKLTSVGSLVAVNGVNVTSEVSGVVLSKIVQSGVMVKYGQSLMRLDDSSDIQDLKENQSSLNLDQIDFNRNSTLYRQHAVSQSDFDDARAALQSSQARVNKTLVTISEKNIRAPFAGMLGIVQVNAGQYISPGDVIASLQQLDPLHVDFYLPEQQLKKVKLGQKIAITVQSHSGKKFLWQGYGDKLTDHFFVAQY